VSSVAVLGSDLVH